MFHFFETPILCGPKLMRKTMPCNHTKTKSYEVFTIRSHDMKHKTSLSWKSTFITKYYNDSIASDVFLLSKPKVFLKKKAKWKDGQKSVVIFCRSSQRKILTLRLFSLEQWRKKNLGLLEFLLPTTVSFTPIAAWCQYTHILQLSQNIYFTMKRTNMEYD